MPVTIDELKTDVTLEPEPQPAGAQAGEKPWDAIERARAAWSRMMRDRARTVAEGFDD